jgi:hypothetical protein
MKKQILEFIYNDTKRIIEFEPKDSDEWFEVEDSDVVFDVHYCEEYSSIDVYKVENGVTLTTEPVIHTQEIVF